MTTSEIRIPLSAPEITEADITAVTEVLRTTRLSRGPKTEEFESALAAYVGARHAIAVSSGTAGLQLALRALDLGEGDEVILPSFTFIGVANALLNERIRPVFGEIDASTRNLDPAMIEPLITSKTRAILVVHTFGYPADLEPICAIARRHGVPIIEDACEALGAEYQGRKVGSIGDVGVFAFYPNKLITSGEGGMVVTQNAGLASTVRALRNQGRRPTDGWLDQSLRGYNFRIPDVNCALADSQLRRIDCILKRRQDRAAQYIQALQAIPDVIAPPWQVPDGRVGWCLFMVQLSGRFTADDRNSILRQMAARGIECGRYFAPLHCQPLCAPFVDPRTDLGITEHVAARTLALPFFNQLSNEQVDEVCAQLRALVLAS